MKGVLVVVVAAALLLLASCGVIFPTGPKPEDLANDLANKLMDLIEAGGVPTYDELRELVYVPNEDVPNEDVEDSVFGAIDFVVFMSCRPSIPTSISVSGVNKIETKLLPWIIDGKPDFVEDVYSVTYTCTREASTTVVNLPMIIVQDKGYFFAVYIKETDGATQVMYYPELLPFL
ncbi:MAG: Uncharacterized protein XD58_1651 [Thermotoga sp. 50_1627]|nr:MAG: Uncharacterized protein XD45_1584 [Thermotoga sp. 50_64]KUK24347.1 MAG: Uncharacterized protein XD58_1651 [Thermotoga sp. 50_1627]HBT39070.1 hypothetical protein [Pseudothermotoga sp.]HCO98347.1 hypothetical protein [Pseudothermotoga sp.]